MSLIQIKSQKSFSRLLSGISEDQSRPFVNLVCANEKGSLIFFTSNSKVVYVLSVKQSKLLGNGQSPVT